MARRTIFAGNWKMNTTLSEAVALAEGVKKGLSGGKGEVAFFPPSVYVESVREALGGAEIDLGVQNIYFENSGAFTGEISPVMAKDLQCRYALVGHSERRHVFGETDEETNKKVRAALDNGLDPMICIGELLDERESGSTMAVNHRQLKAALSGVSHEEMAKVVIAYEPVWAIGTGKVATPEIAQETHRGIRDYIETLYSVDVAHMVPILYGGSVKPDNIAGLIVNDDIDGVLVGGASLKADSFLQIIHG